MFRRFAAGSIVLSIAVAIVAVIVLAIPGLTLQRIYPVLFVWSIGPSLWGVWAMLCPANWVPERFPIWGAILGILAGLGGAVVLNLPARVLGIELSAITRAFAVVGAAVVYYVMWTIVGIAYRKLGGPSSVLAGG